MWARGRESVRDNLAKNIPICSFLYLPPCFSFFFSFSCPSLLLTALISSFPSFLCFSSCFMHLISSPSFLFLIFVFPSILIFPVSPHPLPSLVSTPPSFFPICPSALSALTISLHLFVGQSDQLSNFTWPGVVRWDGQLTRLAAQSSLPIESSYTKLFLYWPLFFAYLHQGSFFSFLVCLSPSSFYPQPLRERER